MDDGSHSLLASGNLGLLAAVVVLLVFAAYFAVAETAFASVSKARIKALVERGDKRAPKALLVLDDFDKAISSILIGTNIVHLATASIVTVVVTRTWGLSVVTLSTIVTTIVVFFVGEMLPKSIAKKYSERLALATAASLRLFMALFGPLAFVLTKIGNAAAGLTRGEPEVSVTEDELYDIIEDMTDGGSLNTEQGELVSSALQFAELTAENILTSRVDLAAVELHWEPERIVDFIKENKKSRLPVYDGTIDKIVGVLQIKKYLKAYIAAEQPPELAELLDKPYFVHRSMNIDELLTVMSTQKLNMAIVTDSYGGTLGIVTVEDILEELVGEIWDEDDEVKESFVPLGGNRWEVSADLSAGEVFDEIGFEPENEDASLEHKLMGEWSYEMLDRIPSERDGFKYGELSVTISEMQQNRIVKLVVSLPLPEAEGGEER